MVHSIDELAQSCNILLDRLVYLYSNSMISREQLLQNSQIKVKFLVDNLDNIVSDTIRSDAIKALSSLKNYLPFEEKEG